MHDAAPEDTLAGEDLAALQRARFTELWYRVLASNAFYQQKLSALSFDPRCDPFEALPFTTRQEIEQDQCAHPPYGSDLTFPLTRYNRLHQTSGSTGTPLRWLDTPDSWEWWKRCWGVVLRAAGVAAADRLLFPFSFGPFIGFWSAFESAAALGNLCLAAGGMTTAARLRYMLDNGVTVVCCTPTYALRMAETAAADGVDLRASPVRALIVAGEPGGSIPATKARIEALWGARVFDHAGLTEVGAWGFECAAAPGGMHVIESEFIAEVIAPRSAAPVPDGQDGELVLTNLGRTGSPLIRYRTGDRVRLMRGRCACGRSFARVAGGVLGRTDDMLVIRGNNVFPSAIENVLRGFAQVAEFRLEVMQRGSMSELRIDIDPAAGQAPGDLGARVAAAIRDRLHFRAEVCVVPTGSLPRFEMKSRRVAQEGSGAGH